MDAVGVWVRQELRAQAATPYQPQLVEDDHTVVPMFNNVDFVTQKTRKWLLSMAPNLQCSLEENM